MPESVLNVLDGAGVIGGTKILLQSRDTNLLLDFGTNFSHCNRYFEEYLRPRASRGLLDVAELGLLPPAPRLYRQDLSLPGTNPWAKGVPPFLERLQVDAVVLTHAHLDHCGYLSYIQSQTPIVCSLTTAFLMKGIQDTSKGDLEKEICYVIPREVKNGVLHSGHWKTVASKQRVFLTLDELKLSADAYGFWANPIGSRPMVHTPIQGIKSVKNVKILSYEVDHSIPGATAFALETEAGWIAYTGDIRLHGNRGARTQAFAEAVSKLKPKVLLCEGTRVTRLDDAVITEADVKDRVAEVIKNTSGLVIADFGSRNIERLLTFREVASDSKRQLVLMTRDVHLLRAYHLTTGQCLEPSQDPLLRLYQEQKSTESTAEKTLYETYKNILIDPTEISKKQAQFILCFSFWDLNELIEVRPVPRSIYIYSSSEAYDEEQKADMGRLRNWLEHFGIKPFGVPDPKTGKALPEEVGFHSSGHASADDLLQVINFVNPEVLIPIHTENPQFFVERCGKERKVILPTTLQPIPF